MTTTVPFRSFQLDMVDYGLLFNVPVKYNANAYANILIIVL